MLILLNSSKALWHLYAISIEISVLNQEAHGYYFDILMTMSLILPGRSSLRESDNVPVNVFLVLSDHLS